MLFLNIYYYWRFYFVRDLCTVIDVTNDIIITVVVSKLINRFSL